MTTTSLLPIVAVVVVLAAVGFGVRVLWLSLLEYRQELHQRDEDLE